MKKNRNFMKKAFFFTVFIFMTSTAYCQTVTFLGVDINQSYTSFTRALSAKLPGGKENPFESTEYFDRTFAGIRDCYIAVKKSPNNHVQSIVVMSKYSLSEDEKARLIASYNSKYEQPYKIETHIDSKTQEKWHTYKYKVGDHLINVTPDAYCLHIVYFPRWFILQTDDI